MTSEALVALPLARVAPGTALRVIQAVPGTSPAGLDQAQALLADHGAVALLQPATSVPFKAWAAVVGTGDVCPASTLVEVVCPGLRGVAMLESVAS